LVSLIQGSIFAKPTGFTHRRREFSRHTVTFQVTTAEMWEKLEPPRHWPVRVRVVGAKIACLDSGVAMATEHGFSMICASNSPTYFVNNHENQTNRNA